MKEEPYISMECHYHHPSGAIKLFNVHFVKMPNGEIKVLSPRAIKPLGKRKKHKQLCECDICIEKLK